MISLNVCLPESVEIAISVSGNGCFVAEGESNSGFFTGVETFAVTATVCLEIHPSDIMLFCHGVSDRTDGNFDDIIFNCNDGGMLFDACIDRTGDKVLHFFAAAHKGDAGVVDKAYEIFTMFTYIEFAFTHDFVPPKIEFIF